MPATVRAVGAAIGIARAEVERLVAELRRTDPPRPAHGPRLLSGGEWLFGPEDDDEPDVRYVSWGAPG